MTDAPNHHDGDQVVRPPDPAVAVAAQRLRALFSESPQRLFYSTQIETALEREFFHWITGKALLQLTDSAEIQRFQVTIGGNQLNFYASKRHRYWKRELAEMRAILARVYDPDFSQAIGRHGELMFDAAFGRAGFRAEAQNTRLWKDKQWIETGHNLDRVYTRDGLAYGAEIKNSQNYISHEELRTKLKLAAHLGLIPLFIMRFAPKSYIYEVQQQGGFTLLFEEQMYPWGHADLLANVRRVLSLKVSSPKDVKEGDIQRLLNWHHRRLKTS